MKSPVLCQMSQTALLRMNQDLKSCGGNVKMYEGLEGFLGAHHRRSSWVDKKWVMEQAEPER